MAEAIAATKKMRKIKASAATGEADGSPPVKKAKTTTVGKSTSKLSLASSSSSLGSTGGGGASKITPAPAILTKDVLQDAHGLLDLAKCGSWDELCERLDAQPELVNVRPEVREYAVLHQAAYQGKVAVVSSLLKKYGADPCLSTKNGQSATDVAKEQGQTKVVKLLSGYFTQEVDESTTLTPEKVEKGSKAEAVHVAPIPKLTSEIIKAAHRLIDHAKSGQWEELFAMLDKQHELVNVRPDVREYSALQQAAYHDNKDAMLTLIDKYGADPTLSTGSGLTLLEVAERQGCHSVIKALEKVPCTALAEAATEGDAMDADDGDLEVKQMPDGSWKVTQKCSSESLGCGTSPATAATPTTEPEAKRDAGRRAPLTTSVAAPPVVVGSSSTKVFPVDWIFPTADKCRVYQQEGTTWHAMLKNGKQFHLVQLIEINPESYCVWNRWGKVDTDGEHEATYFASPELATATFKAKFYGKTNNKWEDRKSFKQFFAKYVYKPEPGIDDNAKLSTSKSAGPLPVPSLTADVTKQAHKLIDFAKEGKWAELFKVLSSHKTLVNVRPEVREFSALHQAAFYGQEDVLVRLIDEFGADPALRSKSGKDVAEVADEQGFSQVAEKVRSRITKPASASCS